MIGLSFVLTSLVLILVPGTGVISTVSTGLLHGRRASIHASLGCALGILPHLAATIGGLAAMLHASASALQLIKFGGAFYLLCMAIATWRDRSAFAAHIDQGRADTSLGGHVLRAFLLNILNPKLTIFFLAYLPQFIDPAVAQALMQMLMLGAVFVVYGLAAHGLRRHVIGSPRLQRGLRVGFAAAFATLGARLALAER